jgi:hypothetical protein
MLIGYWESYFFTQVFVAVSHFMSVIFLQAALVKGASAANVGTVKASSTAVAIAVLRIFTDMVCFLPWTLGSTAQVIRILSTIFGREDVRPLYKFVKCLVRWSALALRSGAYQGADGQMV